MLPRLSDFVKCKFGLVIAICKRNYVFSQKNFCIVNFTNNIKPITFFVS